MRSEAQNWSGGRVWVLAAQSTPPGRTGRPFTARYVHPQWPKTAILAEIRGNNRGKRLVDGRESLSRRPQPPGCTTRPQKTGSRDSTIISLALHTMQHFAINPYTPHTYTHCDASSSSAFEIVRRNCQGKRQWAWIGCGIPRPQMAARARGRREEKEP